MAINTQMIKELRERTGAGMLDCKKALMEVDGDIEKAIEHLRKKGLSKAAKKSGRITAEGVVLAYIHAGGKIGVLVEVNCETDFVARTDDFKNLVHDIALHIAAADPRYLRREEVTSENLDSERSIYREQALAEGKPEKIVDRIVDGRISKYYGEHVLMEQSFVKDPDKTIEKLLAEKVAMIGENIQIRRFTRYALGEGIAKKEEDFAAEVAAQIKQQS